MAYVSSGLRLRTSGTVNEWILNTTDSVATAMGAGYVSDAGPTDVLPGRGMQVGDMVFVRVMTALPSDGEAPADCTDTAWSHVSTIHATTGVALLVLSHTNA